MRDNSLWDLRLRYAPRANGVGAGIRNLFDRDPPASNQTRSPQVGYYPALSSPIGRVF